ncbi:DUF4253 domain-containing protein [Streptomyces sp. NPDC058420]|uniref:DUF4253 domain-containing protein n=1 Tax=Streptomyces sp. NPDC058420 TaxID=3346489 RepID=UPI003667B1E9
MATLPNPLPKLAADPSGSSLGLELPVGSLIDVTADGPADEPLLWCAGEAARPGGWAALRAARGAGLLPVLLDVDGGHGGPQEWELSPYELSYPGDHDADEVLADFWEAYASEGDEWPGLAEALTLVADPDARAVEVADSLAGGGSWLKDPRLALVPARRSADIPAAIGWMGAANHENDTALLCAVLRSWEDRFGIRVVALGFDRLVLSVAAPPATLEEAEEIAAEHFAFCPDNITQGHHETLRAYARHEVLDRQVWSFWWD